MSQRYTFFMLLRSAPDWLKLARSERQRFLAMTELFKKYSDQYDMDYLLMAAQGFQESGLDQGVKSPVGAIGADGRFDFSSCPSGTSSAGRFGMLASRSSSTCPPRQWAGASS